MTDVGTRAASALKTLLSILLLMIPVSMALTGVIVGFTPLWPWNGHRLLIGLYVVSVVGSIGYAWPLWTVDESGGSSGSATRTGGTGRPPQSAGDDDYGLPYPDEKEDDPTGFEEVTGASTFDEWVVDGDDEDDSTW
jgi:hypothetical protein